MGGLRDPSARLVPQRTTHNAHVRGGGDGTQVRAVLRRKRPPLCLLAQSAVRLRGRAVRRGGGACAVPARGPRHVGRRHRRAQHRDGAGVARQPLRPVRLAAADQRASHRGRRHRVPDDGDGRERGVGAHPPRGRPQLYDGRARQQRVARGVSRRGVHQLPDVVVLRGARRGSGVPRPGARRAVPRSRPLERAGVAGERAVSRLPHV